MCRKITSHWQPLFSKKMEAAASFSYKIGGGSLFFSYKIRGGGLIFIQNWRLWQGFGNITGGCSDMVWISVLLKYEMKRNEAKWSEMKRNEDEMKRNEYEMKRNEDKMMRNEAE